MDSVESRSAGTLSTEPPWRWRAYQEMTAARYERGQLSVRFADGTAVRVLAAALLPPATEAPNWEALSCDTYEITVPTASGVVEIPWSTIRRLTDAAYRKHLERAAADQARSVGARLRALREQTGLSPVAVAERVGVTTEALQSIELGQAGTPLTTIGRILDAVGGTWLDLAAAD